MSSERSLMSPRASSRRSAALSPSAALLPAQDRAFFERRFGADFSQVRVHTDAHSADLAGALGAKAFAAGEDIVFSEGRYRPDTQGGRELLAHELAHVAQQQRGGGEGPSESEPRARAAAQTVAQGGTVGGSALGGAPEGIHCDPDDDKPDLSITKSAPFTLTTPSPIDWLKLREPLTSRGLRMDLREQDDILREWDRSSRLLDYIGIKDSFKLGFITKNWILNKGLSLQLDDLHARENPNTIDLMERDWKRSNPGGWQTPIVPLFDYDWFRKPSKKKRR